MYLPVFSKRHKRLIEAKATILSISKSVRRRLLYTINEFNFVSYETDRTGWNHETCTIDDVARELLWEHGWEKLKSYDSASKEMRVVEIHEFIMHGSSHYIFDLLELFSRKLEETKYDFQRKINTVFVDSLVPWRVADNVIFLVDSEYMAEVLESASRLLVTSGFPGAMEEFQKARALLESSDTKESVHQANLALESTMKSILVIGKAKPGQLIRKMIESGIVPDYYDKFLHSFEQILRSVNVARNEERGAGHGQGINVVEVPEALAELVLNLCGALIVFLVRQNLESKRLVITSEAVETEEEPPF